MTAVSGGPSSHVPTLREIFEARRTLGAPAPVIAPGPTPPVPAAPSITADTGQLSGVYVVDTGRVALTNARFEGNGGSAW